MWFRNLSGLALLCAAPAAWSCASCLCGDYTLTLMGVEKNFPGRLRLALDAVSREETHGTDSGREVLTERRTVLGLSYAATQDLSLAVRLPYVAKRTQAANLASESAAGLGDAELLFKWTLAADGRAPSRHLWGLQGGLGLPTSRQERHGDGRPVDIDSQPGTGAWTPSLGAWYGYFRFPRLLHASLVAQDPVGGYQGYNGGTALLGTVSGQYALSTAWSLQLGLEARWAQPNRFSGVEDPDSGGVAAFVAPGVLWSPRTDWLLHLAVQWPALQNLQGEQHERGDIRLGLAVDFAD
ncbi:MAG TPA: hypothetical protein VFV11_00645 [Solimonas sp.]|nr:hypothetical protein [Solimonas sp.]